MIRRVKRIKPKKRFTPVKVVDPVMTGDELEHIYLPPLQPRKKLFVWGLVIFGLWVGFLIVIYVTTVYPQRHGHRAAQSASPTTTQGS